MIRSLDIQSHSSQSRKDCTVVVESRAVLKAELALNRKVHVKRVYETHLRLGAIDTTWATARC